LGLPAKKFVADPRRWQRVWSIGIYAGNSPLSLSPDAHNPVLTARQVTDVDAYYVADPFLLYDEHADHSKWHMFFEVLIRAARRGVIGHATSSDARIWKYDRVVLEEPFHLAYPQVFAWENRVYLLPETLDHNAVRLYEATDFPSQFQPAADLISGRWADPTIFHHQGLWWLLACSTPFENRTLHLFFAEHLRGPWQAHPRNPIVADDRRIARPGGRVRVVNQRLIRFAQDCEPRYGSRLRAIEILHLSPTEYEERECEESPVLQPGGGGWNSVGMHHMDANQLADGSWIASVDGDTFQPGPDEAYA
jgi:hypothetical protein